eukprot:jgi/Botrbrau1/5964/Bobra.0366s0134.1
MGCTCEVFLTDLMSMAWHSWSWPSWELLLHGGRLKSRNFCTNIGGRKPCKTM